jgi:cupin superfamily acireductone dioxygenase involved in methionine salvage
MTEEEMHHVWMYKENLDVQKKAADKLALVREQLEQYNELIDMVYKKFGFVKSDVTEIVDEQTEGDTKE